MARIRTHDTERPRVAAPRRPQIAAKLRTPAAVRSTKPSLTVSRAELLVRGSDKEFRRLVHGLFSFLSRHEMIRAGHARHIDLAGIEYTVLISIAHLTQEGDVSISAIAQHLRLTGAFITNVCNRLVTQGLISKRTAAADRRRVSLSVTKEGRHRLETLAPTQRQINDVEFGCLSAKEFALLLDMIERLTDSAEQASALQRYLQGNQGPTSLGR